MKLKQKEEEEEKKKKRKEETERGKKEKAAKNGDTVTVDNIDVNICAECEGDYDHEPEEWVGCNFCPQWYHIVCTALEGFTDDELREAIFKC